MSTTDPSPHEHHGYLHGYRAEERDRLHRQARFLEPMVHDRLPFRRRKHILEVGCGVGAQTEILLRHFPELHVTGIDIQEEQLAEVLILDTSVIIDGRIADLIESKLLEGRVIVPRFVLKELQYIGDSSDPIRRARGRRGLEMLNRLQRNTAIELRIHEGDFPEEKEVDAKLVRLARNLGAKLFTNDYNLGKIAELQSVAHINIHEVAKSFKTVLLPGEILNLRIVREGKDKGQGVGYLNDGTMVVVNQAHSLIGQQVEVQVQSLLQTGAGVIVFAEVKAGPTPAATAASQLPAS